MITCVCSYCHKMFQSAYPTTTCPACRHLDSVKFEVVSSYLMAHPLSNAIEISKGSNISILDILHFINEGRLQIVDRTEHILADD